MGSRRRKLLFVFGTRPEAIKLAPVIREFSRHKRSFLVRTCVTAQHRAMLDQVLLLFGIRIHHDLNLMRPRQEPADVTARVLREIRTVLERERPDLVVVQGDTTTTLAASIASFYERIPVAHVEAGLRTGDLRHPFPEEMNRILTSRIAGLHLAPTASAKRNLIREGIPHRSITVTGNTAVDALRLAFEREPEQNLPEALEGLDPGRQVILVTGHRRESFGEEFRNICRAIRTIARSFPDLAVVYPVHLNPNVQKPVREILAGVDNIYLLKPVEYGVFVRLMKRSDLILTDSGGIQEEAPSLGKPVLVMRKTSERMEGVEAGSARIVGTSEQAIVREVKRVLRNPALYRKMSRVRYPYGDGKASGRIVTAVRTFLAGAERRRER